LKVDQGTYLLHVSASEGGRPAKFRPVILGLSGSKMGVPEEYLRDFFRSSGTFSNFSPFCSLTTLTAFNMVSWSMPDITKFPLSYTSGLSLLSLIFTAGIPNIAASS